jgi:signal peptidase I
MMTGSNPTKDHGADWLTSLQSLLATVVIAVFVITYVVQAFQIPSESMENTLLIGDYLLVDKLCYGGGVGNHIVPYRPIRRGDIIVFHYPVNPAQHFVKRVIGIPGDRIHLVNKRVFVNGVSLAEPYVRYFKSDRNPFRDDFPRIDVLDPGINADWWVQMPKLVEGGQLIVPEGHYFAMGDNRDDSSDSRYWGFVPQENIIGRPLLIYWSIRNPENDLPIPASVSDRLYHFAYAMTHFFQITRWNRTFRVVS